MKALLFPIAAIVLSFIAYTFPAGFVAIKGYIVPLLVVIMLGMGITLSIDDFKQILHKKKALGLGIFIQFLIMPLAAFLISKAFGFSNEITAGMMLVGTSAGGTASNVMTYLAKGDVALSVSMTLFSTLLSIVLMPFLTWLYIGQEVPVPAMSMLLNLVKIMLVPIVVGVLLNTFFHKFVKKILPALPIISMAAIITIIAIVVALNVKNIQTVGALVALGVVLHNGSGLFCGYFLSKLFGFDEKTARTVAIEVGMQNSGLSVALAVKYFGSLAALPGALFSVWHNLSGSILAGIWSSKSKNEA
ncbi:bile acid:sodium symporter family protein [Campylobacter sp. CCUG 57310]|uniref:bile acid:sodium symporter family protein n=1 Tax=Campylobacter sp. CCUG 57310 TaxID=2517362 RepID=UPI0015678A6A|nr:bile acid:sodium symporter family protein [Campylobacter sp. CCUG 57310]QKF91263.1 bile acid:sodium symporter family protein [Campylobacter sp. CCUG 57310]